MTNILLRLDQQLVPVESDMIQHILAEALDEFIQHRTGGVEEYLDRRYPIALGYTEPFRDAKRTEVRLRLEIAAMIHKATEKVEVTVP